MSRFGTYYARFNTVRSDVTGLPPWARYVFAGFALPGILLVALSVVAFIVSVAALLAIAIPVYLFLRYLTAGRKTDETGMVEDPGMYRPEAKRVDATVRDVKPEVPDEVNGE